jgi:hypothetical protein
VGFDGVLGEAERAAAVDLGLEAASFGAVALEFFVVGAHLAGFGWLGDVVHEALDEAFVGIVGGVHACDGGDGTEVGVEFEVFDDGVDLGGVGVGAGGGGTISAFEVEGGDAEAVEDERGALVVDGVGADAGEDVGEGELDGGGVVDGGKGEDGVEGGLVEVFGAAAGGVVEVAEVLAS